LAWLKNLWLTPRCAIKKSRENARNPYPIFGIFCQCVSPSKFCQKYKPKAKPEKRNFWGSRFLPSLLKGAKAKKSSPGQMSLPWDKQRVTESTEVHEVAAKFIQANCYQPTVPGIGFMKC
jgi:hypothetical protein